MTLTIKRLLPMRVVLPKAKPIFERTEEHYLFLYQSAN